MRVYFKCFMPLIILNTLFGNTLSPELNLFSQFLSIILIAFCIFSLHFIFKYKYTFFILVLLVLTKLFYVFFKINLPYNFVYSLIFALTGAFIFNYHFRLIKSQFLYYYYISGLILFLQLTGWFPLLHYFNVYAQEYVNVYGDTFGKTINFSKVFLTYGDPYSLFDPDQIYSTNVQFRPPGIFHSNAFMGPFMIIGFFLSVINCKSKKNRFIFFTFTTFLMLLTGSKLVIFCSLFCLIISKSYLNSLYFKFILSYFLAATCYFLIFPIVFLTNYNISAVIFSIGIRLIDQLSVFGSWNFLFNDEVVDSYTSLDKGFQGFTGIISFIAILLIITIFYLKYYDRFKFYFNSNFVDVDKRYLYKCIFIWLFFVFFATPLFGNNLISFFIGFIFSPVLINNQTNIPLIK
jgi:hypothetical protein